MIKSKIRAILCHNEEEWNEISFDLSYWRRIPEAEYDEWVDRCEALDQQVESVLAGDGYVIGEITYWRDRSIELGLPELTDERLFGLQQLLVGEFLTWRIAIMVWSDLMDGRHVGSILIGHDFFVVTAGLSEYFPQALHAD